MLDMLAEPKGRATILCDAEAGALMKGAIGDQDPDTRLFVAFGLNTAIRHREILRARVNEVAVSTDCTSPQPSQAPASSL